MSERERLIELLESSPIQSRTLGGIFYKYVLEKIADYLFENGVIVLPVKVGDTVFHYGYSFRVEKIEIVQSEIFYKCGGTDKYMAFSESDLGKTVFLTKEEAEKALKGGVE